ncbi:MAM and LDL-receptor class A domain-containing protein 1-like protein [Dinothrombium tinctorium]|nr:MAM and LDL-receptor class A domain-containing protein 1-like protein [Dinothrombium tinctorium]
MIHLLFHAYGLGHTHNRIDRDNFIYINYEAIQQKTNEFIDPKRFFSDNNYLPITELYQGAIFPNNSLMYTDAFAWSQFEDIAVISPLIPEINPVRFGRDVNTSDWYLLSKIYGRPIEGSCKHLKDSGPKPRALISLRQCPDPGAPSTTIRQGNSTHFGAKVKYTCKTRSHVMLGDSIRTCRRNGRWTGHKPLCLPKKKVKLFCEMFSNDERCKFLDKSSRNEKGNQRRKREADQNRKMMFSAYRHFSQTFTTPIVEPKSDSLCVSFSYHFAPSSQVEVFLEHISSIAKRSLVWQSRSGDEAYVEYEASFVTKLAKLEPFRLHIVGTYEGMHPQNMTINFFHLVEDICHDNI